MDSILASGPRSVRLSGPFRLLAGLRSWAAGTGPSAYHLGYFFEVVRQTLTAQVARMRRARWRAAPFEASFSGDDTATTTVLLFTANRPWYLRRSLRALERFWPSRGGYRLVVSQDGDDQATNSILESLPTGVEHWKFSEQVRLPWRQWIRGRMPYFRIAQHFGHALRRVFANSNTRRVIILEDDMEIGPDFFGYFECLSRVLQENPDLLTASAWNDHGGAATNPTAVHRTDCFPGLGWLLERGGWEVLETCWPQSYWDDVLRQIPELKGYQHLRPDVCRIRNFGRTGTGSSAFFEQHIAATPIQGRPVDWSSVELTLDYQGYRERLFSRIARSRPCRNGHSADTDHDHHLLYGDFTEFQELARELGILPEFRPDAPRAAFEGVVILERGDHALYLVPRLLWERLSSGEPPS